jgi:hypothetical protein
MRPHTSELLPRHTLCRPAFVWTQVRADTRDVLRQQHRLHSNGGAGDENDTAAAAAAAALAAAAAANNQDAEDEDAEARHSWLWERCLIVAAFVSWAFLRTVRYLARHGAQCLRVRVVSRSVSVRPLLEQVGSNHLTCSFVCVENTAPSWLCVQGALDALTVWRRKRREVARRLLDLDFGNTRSNLSEAIASRVESVRSQLEGLLGIVEEAFRDAAAAADGGQTSLASTGNATMRGVTEASLASGSSYYSGAVQQAPQAATEPPHLAAAAYFASPVAASGVTDRPSAQPLQPARPAILARVDSVGSRSSSSSGSDDDVGDEEADVMPDDMSSAALPAWEEVVGAATGVAGCSRSSSQEPSFASEFNGEAVSACEAAIAACERAAAQAAALREAAEALRRQMLL